MPSGGYREPSEPAVQSGPGPLSQRVDGGPASKQTARYIAGGDYGDAGLLPIQQAAPMSATPTPAPQPMQSNPQQMQSPADQVIPLTAPTMRPNEPVTAGAAAGPGPGPEALRIPMQGMQQGGATGAAAVQTLAARPDASPQLKQLASQLGG